MHPLIRLALVAAALAIVAVVGVHLNRSGSQSGWEALAEAAKRGSSVESLEAARERASSTDAGPFIAFDLALKLFDRGQPGDFERAEQIARATLSEHSGHAVAAPLQALLAALESFPQPAGS